MIDEQYLYKGYNFQRMTKDMHWYVIFKNSIVNHGQYRHDLEEWVNRKIKLQNIKK